MSKKNKLQLPDSAQIANSSVPNSFFTNDENKLIENKDKFVKHSDKFKISEQTLLDIVRESEKRTFVEEIEKIESLGGVAFLEKALDTDFKNGIKSNDIKIREEEFSHNRREVRKSEGFFSLLIDALGDFTLRILIVCSVLSMGVELGMADYDHRKTAWIDGFAIMVAVILSSSVQAANDYQKEQQFQSLNKIADSKKMFSVMRDDKLVFLHHSKLLVGDIVILSEGMDVPADGLLIEGTEVFCDESAMTGETEPMSKGSVSDCNNKKRERLQDNDDKFTAHDVPSPILLSGSRVVQGEGKFLIIVVGVKSCLGRIQAKLETETESTPLQEKLEHLARAIGKFGLISAILILTVLLIRFAVERIKHDNFYKEEHWKELIDYLLISITVVVVAIPEGLPLSVVISLAYSVKKMLNDNNLVRRLHACETMGGADTICSDKTGTLTQNEMTFTSFWNERLIDIDTFNKVNIEKYFPGGLQDIFLQTSVINSSAILRPSPKGSSTEIAILKFIEERCSLNSDDIKNSYTILQKFPFSSSRKRMGCILTNTQTLGIKKRLVQKGASELLLDCCSFIHSFQNDLTPITSQIKSQIANAIDSMAAQALRTIIIAYKDLDGNENLTEKDSKGVYSIEKSNLTFFGLLGIKDILRKEVPAAIVACKKSGIKVRMVTGDNKLTARAIAKECGIIEAGDDHSLVLEGADFNLSIGGVVCKKCSTEHCDCVLDEKTSKKTGKPIRIDTIKNKDYFDRTYPYIDVLARSRPEDKYAMVVGLKERNHVVAVTGDGTNDAPALRKADVGFAMGIAGTEVARGASDIILLDDNFSSIVRAVMWGRNIFDSIRKFLQFQLTVNVVAVGIVLVGAAILKQQALQPVQMLWINLIMDTFASLALATEEPSLQLLNRKPHNRNEYMISKKMFKHILGQAIYQFIILLIIIFYGDQFIPEYSDSLDDEILKDNKDLNYYKYNVIDGKKYVRSGRLINISDSDEEDYAPIEKLYGPSRHFTIVFNAFVWMQIFNFLNARRINDEFNVLKGVHKNPLFVIILFLIILFQVVLVSHGSIAFHCYKWYYDELHVAGLHLEQWFICIAFGFGSLVVGLLLKLIPDVCPQLGNKRSDPINDPSKIIEIRRGNSNKKFSSIQHGPGQSKNSFGDKKREE